MAIGDNTLKKSKGTNSLISQFAEEDKIETAVFSLSRLVPFANHPFKLYEGERLDDLIRSVKELGVIVPIIVHLKDKPRNLYEILSGHNRINAAKLAGLDSVPVIIKEGLSDDEAMLIVTETNLIQRSFADLSHSEKAIALKTHMDAIKAQGKRTDIINEVESLLKADEYRDNETCGLIDQKLNSRDRTAEKYGLDSRSIGRYLRLAELDKELQNRVDNGEIGLYPAVSLSYLTVDEQAELNSILENTSYKVDMKKAETLRRLSAEKKLTNEKMTAILSDEFNKKPNMTSKTLCLAPPIKKPYTAISRHIALHNKIKF
jgi:ParB family chromosome partitioning protein